MFSFLNSDRERERREQTNRDHLVTSGKEIPPHFPSPNTIEWSSLRDVELLRHGTGTSLYNAKLDGIPVVVKTPAVGLKPQVIFDVTTELQHEAAVLAGLNHPHVVRFFGHGTIHYGGTVVYFIVVEALRGGTLHQLLQSSRERNCRNRCIQALPHLAGLVDALWYLHHSAAPRHVICHRDLKPDNIGFSADGTIKVFDFGLCGVIARGGAPPSGPGGGPGRLFLRGQTGSIRYMAPEVALGQLYDESIDVYSFSLVAWEMLHLKKPFAGLNVEAHRRVVCMGGGREEMERQVPKPLSDLVQACWRTDPNDRPSLAQLAAALRVMAGLPPAGPSLPMPQAQPQANFQQAASEQMQQGFGGGGGGFGPSHPGQPLSPPPVQQQQQQQQQQQYQLPHQHQHQFQQFQQQPVGQSAHAQGSFTPIGKAAGGADAMFAESFDLGVGAEYKSEDEDVFANVFGGDEGPGQGPGQLGGGGAAIQGPSGGGQQQQPAAAAVPRASAGWGSMLSRFAGTSASKRTRTHQGTPDQRPPATFFPQQAQQQQQQPFQSGGTAMDSSDRKHAGGFANTNI